MIDFTKARDGALEGFLSYSEKLSPLELMRQLRLISKLQRYPRTIESHRVWQANRESSMDSHRVTWAAYEMFVKSAEDKGQGK